MTIQVVSVPLCYKKSLRSINGTHSFSLTADVNRKIWAHPIKPAPQVVFSVDKESDCDTVELCLTINTKS